MASPRARFQSADVLAMAAMLAAAQAAAGSTIVALGQNRSTLAYTQTDCEGTIEQQDTAGDFGPFDSAVGSFQICDAENIFANATAAQVSQIGESSLTANGEAFVAAESPFGLHAYAFSFFEVTFEVPAAIAYTAQGELGIAWGLAGGHEALVSLAGTKDEIIFSHILVGNGGPPETLAFAESGALEAGQYVLTAYASISPADLLPAIPFAEPSFDLTFDVTILGDLDGDGTVGIVDLLALLAAWGPCSDPCPPSCPGDLDGDCVVGIIDLLALLGNWG